MIDKDLADVYIEYEELLYRNLTNKKWNAVLKVRTAE